MVDIRQIPMGSGIGDFLDVVSYIYRGDPAYVRPLDMDLKDRLNPKKNPFFEHGEGAIFCAYQRPPVGRCTATIDREHLARYEDATGFFGFLDTIDDEEVARALLARAESWLRGKGMKRVRGPLSLNINEEMGCLVDGFDTPPYILMPHHKPYQAGLIEKAGYTKIKDFYAWKYSVGELNARVKRARDEIAALPEVTHRQASLKNLDADTEILVDVFNDAWSDNWGFVPFTRERGQEDGVGLPAPLDAGDHVHLLHRRRAGRRRARDPEPERAGPRPGRQALPPRPAQAPAGASRCGDRRARG